MKGNWLVVGIGGATCSGKTTLAEKLRDNWRNSLILSQDKYFLPADDTRHILIPELNHLNWELLSSLDMAKMINDIKEILESPSGSDVKNLSVLILDGFLLYSCKEIADLCDLRYFLNINEEECRERRKLRIYDPPDVPNYFDKVVWPAYVESRREILEDKTLSESIIFLAGTASKEEIFKRVFNDIKNKSTRST